MARRTVTPAAAKIWLANNPNNRNISEVTVERYASDMAAKRWRYNGDPVRISVKGRLLDGQHRLMACIRAGVPFETEVIEGLPDDVKPTIDTGRRRSAADVINMLGLTAGGIWASAGAASCKFILNYLAGAKSLSAAVSTPAIIQMLHEHPELLPLCKLAVPAKRIIAPGPLGAVIYLASRNPTMEKRIRQFVEPLAAGEGLTKGDPRLVLRNAFIARRRETKGGGVRADWAFAMIANSWNAFATGRSEMQYVRAGKRATGGVSIPDVIGAPKFGANAPKPAKVVARTATTATRAR